MKNILTSIILIILASFTITTLGISNLETQVSTSLQQTHQQVQNNQNLEFQIQNNNKIHQRILIKLSNSNFKILSPNKLLLKPHQSKTIKLQNINAFSDTQLSIIDLNSEQEINYQLLANDYQLVFDSPNLNFQDQTHLSSQIKHLELSNLSSNDKTLQLKLSNSTFSILSRKSYHLKGKQSQTIQLIATCRKLGKQQAQLELYTQGQKSQIVPLQVNCIPDFQNLAYIKKVPREINLGFLQNGSSKTQNYQFQNLGEQKLQLKAKNQLKYFQVEIINNKLQIQLASKNLKCTTNCKVQEVLVLESNDPYKKTFYVPIRALVQVEEVFNPKLYYKVFNPCSEQNKTLEIYSNSEFNLEILKHKKTIYTNNNFLKSYKVKLACDPQAKYTLKVQTAGGKYQTQLDIQKRSYFFVSKREIQENSQDQIVFTPQTPSSEKLNLQIIDIDNKQEVYNQLIPNQRFKIPNQDIKLPASKYLVTVSNAKSKFQTHIQVKKK